MARLIDRRHGIRTAADQAAAFHNRERRKARMEKNRFSGQIASPFALGSASTSGDSPNPLALLGAGYFAVSFDEDVTAGQLTIDTSTGRTLATPALTADTIYPLGYLERGVTLTPSSAVAGDVTIYYLDDRRQPFAIATGDFS